ncbi:MAG: NTP transferase domain-containing protein [Defluviitaleaceae bacterium]|nr:NTP transferase domain-containing protein [Defluviitaleaceae bacterium]
MKPALVVMAAGLGSRFGGLKQLSSVGPNGEYLMDYSVYDALSAGFGKIVFVIKQETEQIFREALSGKLERVADVRYVYQDIKNIPASRAVPPGRVKPWGTAHAVLSASNAIQEPFAVINADDFYGAGSFRTLCEFLSSPNTPTGGRFQYAMVGFRLANTLSASGSVSRGVCVTGANGLLAEIDERTRIELRDGKPCYTEDGQSFTILDMGAVVSMNMWGFDTNIFNEIENQFGNFFASNAERIDTAEFYLPSAVDSMIKQGKADVTVLSTPERWLGLTNPADLELVRSAIVDMINKGTYPVSLWS